MSRFINDLVVVTYDKEQDMSGKTVLITGATSGIGKATALEMARRNARVLLACRNMTKAKSVAREIETATGNPNVIVKLLDLCSFESVRKCAKSILETEDKLHVLINNAGLMSIRHEMTRDGCDLVMQSNHFGHFLLTLLLLDLLKKGTPSRIINVSSIGHHFSRLDLENLNNEKKYGIFYRAFVYGNSKLANILFTKELAERLSGTGIMVNSLNPGAVSSGLLSFEEMGVLGFIICKIIFLLLARTPEKGAQTTIRLAVDPDLENTTGKYFSNCTDKDVARIAKDPVVANRLFEISEQIVGEKFKMPS